MTSQILVYEQECISQFGKATRNLCNFRSVLLD